MFDADDKNKLYILSHLVFTTKYLGIYDINITKYIVALKCTALHEL